MSKHYYAWAVVGNGDPEPVAVKGEKGSRQAFTIACPDPYDIDEADCPCRLLRDYEQDAKDNRYIAKMIITEESEPMRVPNNPFSAKFKRQLEAKFRSDLAPKHSYAGFGRPA